MSLRNIQLTTTLTFSVPQIVDITDQLPKKQSWETLPNKKNIIRGVWDGTYHTGPRKYEDIDTIIVHHSGPPEGTLVSHANYHAKEWGAGIAYHIAIDGGAIKQTNDLLSFSFHAGGHNTYTVGIVVNADLSKREMTSHERELLYAAILTVKSILPIKQILGHNEVNKTACPCTSVNKIREDIAKLEMEIERSKTIEAQIERCFAVKNQSEFMYNKAKLNDGDGVWARTWLDRVHAIMKSQGLL